MEKMSNHYVVYGDGADYIVVDGVWDNVDNAKERAEFLNSLKDGGWDGGYLSLNWTVEDITIKGKDDINLIPDHESGWFLK